MTNRYHNLEAFHRAVADMTADPEVTGDLLLVGIWFARATILNEPPRGTGQWVSDRIVSDLFGQGAAYTITGLGIVRHVSNENHLRVQRALESDIPRYDPFIDNDLQPGGAGNWSCSAPMVRRATPCGRPYTVAGFQTDLETGRAVPVATCGRPEHRNWFREQSKTYRAALEALGDRVPEPAANVGGALARHIHGINWPNYWRKLKPDWTPPAEGAPTRKPTLTVLTSDEFEPTDNFTPPVLRRIEGGWR